MLIFRKRLIVYYQPLLLMSFRNCKVLDNYFVVVTQCWNVSYVNSAVADEYIGKLTLMKQVSLLQSYMFSPCRIFYKNFKWYLLIIFRFYFHNKKLELVCKSSLGIQFSIEKKITVLSLPHLLYNISCVKLSKFNKLAWDVVPGNELFCQNA